MPLILPDDSAGLFANLVPNAKWLAKGLTHVFIGNKCVWSAFAGARPMAPTGGPKLVAGKFGPAVGFGSTYGSGTTDRLDGGVLPRPASGWRSIVAHYYANGTGGGGLARIFQDVSGSGVQAGEEIQAVTGPFMLYGLYATGAYGAWYTSVGLATGRWQSFGVTHDQRTVNVTPSLWMDGAVTTAQLSQAASGSYQTTPCNMVFGNRPSDSARCWDGLIGPVLIFDGALTNADHAVLDRDPLQVFDPDDLAIWLPFSTSGAVTHDATGTPAASAATVSGASARTHVFASSGALAAGSAIVAGTAARTLVHAATGALSDDSSTIAGTANRTHVFAASGALADDSASIAGAAARTHAFATSGALADSSATIAGTSARTHEFASSGAIAAADAVVAGTAARAGAAVSHATSGALACGSSVVSGAASRASGAVTHATSGSAASDAATVSGIAARTREHPASGVLSSGSATVAGVAARSRIRTTTGTLTTDAAAIAGVANRASAPVSHATSGALTATASAITGTCSHTGSAELAAALASSKFARIETQRPFVRTTTPRPFGRV